MKSEGLKHPALQKMAEKFETQRPPKKVGERLQEATTRAMDDMLGEIADRLHREAMNSRCDVSATGEKHIVGFKAGHKQARHNIAEMILEVLAEYRS